MAVDIGYEYARNHEGFFASAERILREAVYASRQDLAMLRGQLAGEKPDALHIWSAQQRHEPVPNISPRAQMQIDAAEREYKGWVCAHEKISELARSLHKPRTFSGLHGTVMGFAAEARAENLYIAAAYFEGAAAWAAKRASEQGDQVTGLEARATFD